MKQPLQKVKPVAFVAAFLFVHPWTTGRTIRKNYLGWEMAPGPSLPTLCSPTPFLPAQLALAEADRPVSRHRGASVGQHVGSS